MKPLDWSGVQRIHIVGIGGIGLSALAQLLQAQGKEVSGCDRGSSPVIDMLKHTDISVYIGHSPEHITSDIDLLIYSDAVHEDNSERMRAQEIGIPSLSYFQALGQMANQSKCLIAVAGAHGKTTTTAMLTDVLEAADLNPTVVVGSLRAKTKSNFRAGGNDYFVVEADEYMRHFLNFSPQILVITNIDADHLDYYKDLADIQSAFRALAEKVPQDGFVVCDAADANVKPVIAGLACTVIDYRAYFDPEMPLKVLPLNRINAAAALALANVLKIDAKTAKSALGEFSGTWRRFEYKGKTESGALIYDDYAHHPAEIEVTLRSVRAQFPDEKIIVAFHPHLYSRTKILLNEFATAFLAADEVLIAPIFAAREEPDPEISSEILAQKISEKNTKARSISSMEEMERELQNYGSDSLILTMGAGDIYKVGEKVLQKKSRS